MARVINISAMGLLLLLAACPSLCMEAREGDGRSVSSSDLQKKHSANRSVRDGPAGEQRLARSQSAKIHRPKSPTASDGPAEGKRLASRSQSAKIRRPKIPTSGSELAGAETQLVPRAPRHVGLRSSPTHTPRAGTAESRQLAQRAARILSAQGIGLTATELEPILSLIPVDWQSEPTGFMPAPLRPEFQRFNKGIEDPEQARARGDREYCWRYSWSQMVGIPRELLDEVLNHIPPTVKEIRKKHPGKYLFDLDKQTKLLQRCVASLNDQDAGPRSLEALLELQAYIHLVRNYLEIEKVEDVQLVAEDSSFKEANKELVKAILTTKPVEAGDGRVSHRELVPQNVRDAGDGQITEWLLQHMAAAAHHFLNERGADRVEIFLHYGDVVRHVGGHFMVLLKLHQEYEGNEYFMADGNGFLDDNALIPIFDKRAWRLLVQSGSWAKVEGENKKVEQLSAVSVWASNWNTLGHMRTDLHALGSSRRSAPTQLDINRTERRPLALKKP